MQQLRIVKAALPQSKQNIRKLEGEFMSNIEIAAFQSNLIEELDDAELDDADLMAVVGGSGSGLVSGLATGVSDANNAIGNGGRPTSGLLTLVGNGLVDAGNYVLTVTGGVEGGLQAVNATVTETTNQI